MEFASVIISVYMIRLLLVFGTLSFFSCKNSENVTLVDVIKSNCFWDRTGERQVIGGLNSCYRFLPNGQCFFYYYNFYNQKKTDSVYRFEDNDIVVPTTWSVHGDSLLIARGTHYKVLAVAQDSIIVEGHMNDIMVFRKNCQTVLSSR